MKEDAAAAPTPMEESHDRSIRHHPRCPLPHRLEQGQGGYTPKLEAQRNDGGRRSSTDSHGGVPRLQPLTAMVEYTAAAQASLFTEEGRIVEDTHVWVNLTCASEDGMGE